MRTQAPDAAGTAAGGRGAAGADLGTDCEQVTQLQRRGIPVVLLDRAGDASDLCSVSVDDVEGGRLAMQHLLDQGHTHIALVGGPGDLQQVPDRRLGAEVARSRHGNAQMLTISTPNLDTASGAAAAGELAALTPSERPTAVFAANDLLAIGVLQGLVTQGLRVPEDVAILGYDDVSFAASAAVPLSSIRQPRRELGRRAAELLLDEIETSSNGEQHEHQAVRFNPELIVRRSSAARVEGWETIPRAWLRTSHWSAMRCRTAADARRLSSSPIARPVIQVVWERTSSADRRIHLGEYVDQHPVPLGVVDDLRPDATSTTVAGPPHGGAARRPSRRARRSRPGGVRRPAAARRRWRPAGRWP